MTTIITRLYAAEAHAHAAVDALKQKFGSDVIGLVTSRTGGGASIQALLVKNGVTSSQAAAYAQKVAQGGAVVTVKAAWGLANDAIKHLDAHKPIEAAECYIGHEGWNAPAPFSALLGMPTIEEFKSDVTLAHDPAPISDLIGLPTLSNMKPMATLIDQAAPYSDLAKFPTISRMKPFSKLLDSKPSAVLASDCASPLSDMFFLPVLLRDWRD
jgi:hypothetical protein